MQLGAGGRGVRFCKPKSPKAQKPKSPKAQKPENAAQLGTAGGVGPALLGTAGGVGPAQLDQALQVGWVQHSLIKHCRWGGSSTAWYCRWGAMLQGLTVSRGSHAKLTSAAGQTVGSLAGRRGTVAGCKDPSAVLFLVKKIRPTQRQITYQVQGRPPLLMRTADPGSRRAQCSAEADHSSPAATGGKGATAALFSSCPGSCTSS